jgi:hypothetical protein
MFIICEKCRFGLQVLGGSEDIDHLVGEGSPHWGRHQCPLCGGLCKAAPFADAAVTAAKHMRSLTPMEAHLLFEGMGFPEERDCVADIVKEELKKPIKRVKAFTVPNTNRSVLESLELEDGTTVFLSGCAEGALVYRIRKPHLYSDQVHEDHP